MRIETITSLKNTKIKELLALRDKSSKRREKSYFVVEGFREFMICLAPKYAPVTNLASSTETATKVETVVNKSNSERGLKVASSSKYKLRTVFVCPEILGKENYKILLEVCEKSNSKAGIIEIPQKLYSKIAYRGGTEGVIAEIEYKLFSLEDLILSENPLIVVLESVEKPGNLGAVLRSADAAGADAVIICDPLTDLYNPNLIRASLGASFTVQTVAASTQDTIEWLKQHEIKILTAQLQDSSFYYDTPMQGATAIVMGTEADGLTLPWRDAAEAHIKIPMNGLLDSLNVSVSAAILLFEAVRQRQS